MRGAVLTLLLLSILSAAAAGPADAPVEGAAEPPACRLAPADCARALHEVAADAEAMARDGEMLGFGLPAAERARALLRRDDDRMAERLRRLPAPIAGEVRRLQACRALDAPAPRSEGADPDPVCR